MRFFTPELYVPFHSVFIHNVSLSPPAEGVVIRQSA